MLTGTSLGRMPSSLSAAATGAPGTTRMPYTWPGEVLTYQLACNDAKITQCKTVY
jgi:hypothetical protein